jgi:hypothetical protein
VFGERRSSVLCIERLLINEVVSDQGDARDECVALVREIACPRVAANASAFLLGADDLEEDATNPTAATANLSDRG